MPHLLLVGLVAAAGGYAGGYAAGFMRAAVQDLWAWHKRRRRHKSVTARL